MKISECIFVFGSNLYGINKKGAALTAKCLFNAEDGLGFGLSGNSFAIPTKDNPYVTLPLETIESYVELFFSQVELYPDKTFLVTRIGCGLAGYTDKDIAPLFSGAPYNCILPDGWSKTHRVHHIESITKADMDKEVW